MFSVLITFSALSQSNKSLEEVPFEIIGNHQIIKLQVNNSDTLNFIFDTGVTKTIMSKRTAELLDLPIHRQTKTGGLNGKFKAGISKGNSLNIGEIKLNNLIIEIAPLQHFEKKIGTRVDGFIGYSLLKEYVVKIDNEKSLISIYNFKDYIPSISDLTIDMQKGKLCFVEAQVALNESKEISGQFLIDTGSGIPLILSSSFISENSIKSNIGSAFSKKITGYAKGDLNVQMGKIVYLRIKKFKVNHVKTALLENSTGILVTDLVAGIIGNPIMRKFNVTFDYKRKKTYWNQNKDSVAIDLKQTTFR